MLPEPTISTALIGCGGAQWYPHQPSGKRRYQVNSARSIVLARYARHGGHATGRSGQSVHWPQAQDPAAASVVKHGDALLFGGAAIVPGTGELLFMQPSEWVLSAKERESAGEVRIKQAKRAGINRAVSYR